MQGGPRQLRIISEFVLCLRHSGGNLGSVGLLGVLASLSSGVKCIALDNYNSGTQAIT